MEKLKSYRKARKLTQAGFAALIGVTPSVVSRYEAGLVSPDLPRAIIIEKATGGAIPAVAWEKPSTSIVGGVE